MTNAKRTQQKNNWQKAHVDRINLTVPKGRRADIKSHAQAHGESVNGFIGRAIAETIERDQEDDKRNQQIIQIAAESGKSTEDVKHDIEIEEALKILERETPRIRKLYQDEKQRELPPNNTVVRLMNLDDPK